MAALTLLLALAAAPQPAVRSTRASLGVSAEVIESCRIETDAGDARLVCTPGAEGVQTPSAAIPQPTDPVLRRLSLRQGMRTVTLSW
jgi:hypothetical protein